MLTKNNKIRRRVFFKTNIPFLGFTNHAVEQLQKRKIKKQHVKTSLKEGYITFQNTGKENKHGASFLLVAKNGLHLIVGENNKVLTVMPKKSIKRTDFYQCDCPHCRKNRRR